MLTTLLVKRNLFLKYMTPVSIKTLISFALCNTYEINLASKNISRKELNKFSRGYFFLHFNKDYDLACVECGKKKVTVFEKGIDKSIKETTKTAGHYIEKNAVTLLEQKELQQEISKKFKSDSANLDYYERGPGFIWEFNKPLPTPQKTFEISM